MLRLCEAWLLARVAVVISSTGLAQRIRGDDLHMACILEPPRALADPLFILGEMAGAFCGGGERGEALAEVDAPINRTHHRQTLEKGIRIAFYWTAVQSSLHSMKRNSREP
jgi:hypothetical protein